MRLEQLFVSLSLIETIRSWNMPKKSKPGKGRGHEFDWVPLNTDGIPRKGAPQENEKWKPVDRWMQENGGSVPENELFIFGEDGRKVSVQNVRCGQTYFTMYKALAVVPACPAALVIRRLDAKARRIALSAAIRVRRACQRHPSCNGVIRLQVKASGCNQVGIMVNGIFVPRRSEAWAGRCYRIECFTL